MAARHKKTDKNAMFVKINGNFLSKQAVMRELGITDQRTFDRHYSEEYKDSRDFWATKTIASLMRNLAMGKESTTLKCAKEFIGFNPVEKHEHSGSNGEPLQPIYNITVVGKDEGTETA